MQRDRPRHDHRRALPRPQPARLRRDGRRLLRRGPAARAQRGASSCSTAASPRTPSSSSASAARPPAPPACSTRTSSASSTAASGTAPTTSRWSTSRGTRSSSSCASTARCPRTWPSTSRSRSCARRKFAHKRGVVHRDIKPHNVILDEEGRAKVTDFGIARAGASDMTETGSIMGTAQYLSPEQAQGQPVSPRSDLYSIGVMLYELLTGQVPFDAESAVTIALKHVSEAPVAAVAAQPGGAARARRGRAARAREGPRAAGSPTPTSSRPRCSRRASARPWWPPGRCSSSRIRCRASRSSRRSARRSRWWLWLLLALLLIGAGDRRLPAARAGAQAGARRGRQPLGGRLPAAPERGLRGQHRDGPVRRRCPTTASRRRTRSPARRPRDGLDRDDHRLQRARERHGAGRRRTQAGRGGEHDEGGRLQDRRAPRDRRTRSTRAA